MNDNKNWQTAPADELICYCSSVTKKQVVLAIKNGANSINEIQRTTGAGVGGRCKELNPLGRCCHPDLAELLRIYSVEE